MKKIVLTGGTHCGKTTVVEELKLRGFLTVPDVGFEIIQELNNGLGIEKQKEFRQQHPEEFYQKIIHRQLEEENQISKKNDKLIFLDRGVYDYVAFAQFAGYRILESLIHDIAHMSYDHVFFFEPLETFDERKETGRLLSKKDSEMLSLMVEVVYKKHGFDITKIPLDSVDSRIDNIMNIIHSIL